MSGWLTPAPDVEHAGSSVAARRPGVADGAVPQVARAVRMPALPGLAVGSRAGTVRRIKPAELQERGAAVAELARDAPEEGMNLWVARHAELDATIHLLGTHHGLSLTRMRAWRSIVRYLRDAAFTHVYCETTGRGADGALPETEPLIELLEQRVAREADLQAAEPESKAAKIANAKVGNLDLQTGKLATLQLDDAYAALATAGRPKTERGTLETDETRGQAHARNAEDGVATAKPQLGAQEQEAQNARDKAEVAAGNQRAIFGAQAEEMTAGLDLASAEERNRQWVAGTKVGPKDNQVWIVGAAHLPGLLVRLRNAGWTAEHTAP